MMKRTYIQIIFSMICMMGCLPSKTINHTNAINTPSSYTLGNDSTNIAKISWREYFSDKNLISLIDSALVNNFDALIALQRIDAARANLIYNKGALLPKVEVGARAALWRYGLYTQEGAGNSTTPIYEGRNVPTNLPDYLVGFQSSWEADISGKLRNKKRAAFARYLASKEGRNWLITNLVADIALTYYELQALDNELEIIEESIALQENAVSVVTIQKQAALSNELAVQQFTAQLLNTRALAIQVKQHILQAESKINFLLARPAQPIIRQKEIQAHSIPTKLNVGQPSELLSNRPDIRQLELELTAAKADLRVARAAFYPSFTINGSLGLQAFNPYLLFTTPESFAFTLAGGLSAPFINRSNIKANFKAATAYQVELLYQYQKTILNGYFEVFIELNNINNLQKIFELRSNEVNIFSQSIETSNELFRTGRATYLEVLLTQQNALNAKLSFIDVQKHQLFSRVNIYKSLGGGWN